MGRLEGGKEGEKYWNQIVISKLKKKELHLKLRGLVIRLGAEAIAQLVEQTPNRPEALDTIPSLSKTWHGSTCL